LVLYRLLTGRGPFDGSATFDELRQAQIHQVPAPASSHLQAPLPPALDELLLRCLAKDPAARPASAEAMAAALRRIEVDAREALGDEYITDTIEPPTTMGESRMWQRSVPPPLPGYVSVRQVLWVMITFLVMGMLLGGFIVGVGSGG
jgi:serine/threonine protein kinase